MNPTKKFWYDENSEPPKNYIWVKNDKQYEFSVSERRWKEISSSKESDGSSKEITIDDVVKFIHDNTENSPVDIPTKYNDIKHISEPLDGGYNLVRGTEQEINEFFRSNTDSNIKYVNSILISTNYNVIVIKNKDDIQ